MNKALLDKALLIGWALACPALSMAATVDLDTVLARHTEARGGARAIEAVQAIAFDLEIVEPKFTVHGRYCATRSGSMRIDVYADGKRVFTEGLDHGAGWQMPQGEDAQPRPASQAGTATLRHGLEGPLKVFGLHELTARGDSLALLGRETADGVSYYVVELALQDGYTTRYFVNPRTWLIDRERQFRAMHVDVNPEPEWIETMFEDYRPVAGVLYPMRTVDRQLATGTVLSTTTIEHVDVNPDFPPGLFDSGVGTTGD
jgi:hypothetical protein